MIITNETISYMHKQILLHKNMYGYLPQRLQTLEAVIAKFDDVVVCCWSSFYFWSLSLLNSPLVENEWVVSETATLNLL